jgi:predicted transcriptional regulator
MTLLSWKKASKMKVENHVSLEYPRVDPFEAVNAIEDSLIRNRFLVVSDEESNYYGILVPSDIVTRPHKLVIDCLTDKPVIDSELDIKAVFDLMINKKHTVLPVFKGNSFIGIISADKAAEIVKSHTEELTDLIVENKAEIDQLKKEVQVSERLKISLLRNINHEIRTPLAGLVGFSSL